MSRTDYSCMFLIDSKLYDKKILQSDNDNSLNSHYHRRPPFQSESLSINPIMPQPQIIIKNDMEKKKANNIVKKAEATKNTSTQYEKTNTDDDIDMIDQTDQSNENKCFDCTEKGEDAYQDQDVEADKEEISQKKKCERLQNECRTAQQPNKGGYGN